MATKKSDQNQEPSIVDEVDEILGGEKEHVSKADVARARGKEPNGPPSAGRLKGGQTQKVTITIPSPNFQKFQVGVTNIDPETMEGEDRSTLEAYDEEGSLIVNSWSQKAIREMLKEHMGVVDKKTKKQNREKKDAFQDFLGTLYTDRTGYFAFPSVAFKNAMISACRLVPGVTMTSVQYCVHILGHLSPLYGFPNNRLDMVKIGKEPNKVPDVRFRAEFPRWMILLTIRHDADVISQEQVLRLMVRAGLTVGVGEWRLENLGVGGSFNLVQPDRVRQLQRELGRYRKEDLNLENSGTLEILKGLELHENYLDIFTEGGEGRSKKGGNGAPAQE